jgi:proteasome-associated ATPase
MLFGPEDEARVTQLLNDLRVRGPQAPTRERQVEMVQALRTERPGASALIDLGLVHELVRLRAGLERASHEQQELRRLLERLTAPPLHVATFLAGGADRDGEPLGVVGDGATRRVVRFADGVPVATIRPGDEVLLGPERNVIVGDSRYRQNGAGETAVFDRWVDDTRVVVRVRDEELVLTAAASLRDANPATGDVVRWDRALWLAFETLPRSSGTQFLLGSTPPETFADVGGLGPQVEQLQRMIRLHYDHREVVARYALQPRSAVLLSGPPGTGKTLIARALANWVGTLSPSGRSRFINVRPGSLHSMWFSRSEENYREVFRVARQASEHEPDVPVVMFFDEVDAIGIARGDAGEHRVEDRVMTAFLAELNGLESRGRVLVVCATNRRDALDPALLRSGGRLGDLVLEIPRPNRRAAADILARHLPPDVPCAGDAEHRRQLLIDATVSRIFAPNGLGPLATVTLRDGRRQAITAPELVSGAALANIARHALERACLRDAEGGSRGLALDDLLHAVDAEFETAARTLTPANCRRFLQTLPQDVDVVRVERAATNVPRAWRYLSVA